MRAKICLCDVFAIDNHYQLHHLYREPLERPRPAWRIDERPMYVCICNALRDKELAAAAGDNARSVAEVFRRCSSRPKCGKCLPDVAEMIEDARARQSGSAIAAE